MKKGNGNFGSSIEGNRDTRNPRKKGAKNVFDSTKAEEYLRSLDEREEECSSQEMEELVQKAQRLAVVLLGWLCYKVRANSVDGYRPGKELQELEALCAEGQAYWKKEAVLKGLLNGLVDRFSPAVGKAGVVSFLKWLEERKMLLPSSDKNAPLRFLSWRYSPPNSRNRIDELQSLFKALEAKVKVSLKDEAEKFIQEQMELYHPLRIGETEGRRQFEEGKLGHYIGEINSQKLILPGGVVKYLGGATVLVKIATRTSKEGELRIVLPVKAVGAAKEKFELAKARNLYVLHSAVLNQVRIGRIEGLPDEDSKLICQVHQFIRRALGLPIGNGAQATAATAEDPDAGSPSSSVD
jgi:hypothetical protein